MEGGIFLEPAVQQLLEQYELFEVFTDWPEERSYAAIQKRLTGLNVNPTYLVLDSENLLFVAASSFTNSQADFEEFLRDGLRNRPAFASWIRFGGAEIKEGGKLVTVLSPEGSLEHTRGEDTTYLGEPARQYTGEFRVEQLFRVGDDLQPGRYTLRPLLVAGLYEGDRFIETVSVQAPLRFEVLPD